ncbi:MAG: TIGR00730 family Rossman fold protein, partial [Gammaproteobacteria bacterium]
MIKTTLKSLAVFCGSSSGNQSSYENVTQQFAEAMVDAGITLVYGGGNVGLMGVLAKAVLNKGGQAIGVIPKILVEKELAYVGLTHLHIVDSMHERKALMAELSQGVVLLPGGFGSLDEFFEMLTWSQLNLHSKPCGILNVEHYFSDLIKFLDHAEQQDFVTSEHREMIMITDSP